jgi:hypothetical protein
MIKSMRYGVPHLFKAGTKHLSGIDNVVLSNIEACQALASITR